MTNRVVLVRVTTIFLRSHSIIATPEVLEVEKYNGDINTDRSRRSRSVYALIVAVTDEDSYVVDRYYRAPHRTFN